MDLVFGLRVFGRTVVLDVEMGEMGKERVCYEFKIEVGI